MITINLKPGTKRAKSSSSVSGALARLKGAGEKIKDPYRLGALVLSIVWLGFVALGQLSTSAELSSLQPKLDQARAENQRFRAFLGEKKRLESVRDSIQAQITTIKNVDGDRYVWPHLLDEIARAIPPFTWLTDVQYVAQTPAPISPADTGKAAKPVERPPVTLMINGRTIDIQGYTRLLRQLEDSPWIQNVTAISANTVVDHNKAVTAFVLKANYQKPSLAGTHAVESEPAPTHPVVQPAAVAQARGN
jgi:Tfp pilus assembly protein PilN